MIIDPKTINNSWSIHEMLTQVVPAINRLGDRVQQLEAEVKSLRGQSVRPAPVAMTPAYDGEPPLLDPIFPAPVIPKGRRR